MMRRRRNSTVSQHQPPELTTYRCVRCGHGPWIPRKWVYPTTCPSCKSPYWDRKKAKAS